MNAIVMLYLYLPILTVMIGSGSAGLPMGVPPTPEDPMMTRVAPEECLFYTSWAGMAAADPNSPNQTEQLLAEPEIRRLFANLKEQVQAKVTKAADEDEDLEPEAAMIQQAIVWNETLLAKPAAFFVTSLKIDPRSGTPDLQGGAVFAVGDDAGTLKAMLERYQKQLPPEAVKQVEIEGETWHVIQVDADAPSVTWGVKGPYLIVGVGNGEVEGILQRSKTPAPAWLSQLRSELVVDRVATITYANTTKLIAEMAPLGGPGMRDTLDALGFTGVKSLGSVAGLDEKGFVSRTRISLDGDPQGLLRLAGAEPLSTDDLKAIPADATLAMAVRLDVEALMEMILEVSDRIEPRAREDMSRGLGEIKRAFEIDVVADVLAPLGDVWRVYNSPSEGGFVFTGATAVVKVDDMKKLSATNQKLVILSRLRMGPQGDPRTPHIAQFEFAGHEIYYYSNRDNFPLAPAWCLTDDELIVAPYPQNVKAYLSRAASVEALSAVPEVAAAMNSSERPLLLCYNDAPRLFELAYAFIPYFAKPVCDGLQELGINVTIDMLPSAPSIGRHLRPGVTTIRRTASGIELTTHKTPPGGIGGAALASIALRLPDLGLAGSGGRQTQSMNNMKQIGLAMHCHADAHKAFPPAYTTDKQGKPLLSWRVQILPYLEDGDLYKQFRLDEPWDSEHNKKLIERMPAVYRSPKSKAAPGYTNYLTARDEGTVFPGAKGMTFRDMRDGTSNTIMIVEASDERAVPWTKPDDLEYDPENPMAGLVGLQKSGFLVTMCDGSVRLLPADIDADVLKALFTRNGGERIPWPLDE